MYIQLYGYMEYFLNQLLWEVSVKFIQHGMRYLGWSNHGKKSLMTQDSLKLIIVYRKT